MNGGQTFLTSLSVVLCVAAVTTVLFQSLRQPVVLGYLLAGLIVGPHVPVPLNSDPHTAEQLAELGVILLMFSLGLEFSLRRLARVGATSAAVALVEVSVVASLGWLAARALGWTSNEAMYAAAMVAISSSTIVTKVFRERRVEGGLRDLVFGVLIVEDLVAILLLATLTALSSGRGVSASLLGGTAARLVGFLAATLTVGMLVVPRVMRFVVRLDRPETTLVASVGLCFAASLLARHAGYSVALGAFLAGSLVAESGEGARVEALIEPVRDMFAAVFFVAVGMEIDPAVIAHHLGAVALLTAVVVFGKVVGVTLGAFLGGHGVRRSLTAGVSLGQIGEFSFIIVALGGSLHVIGPQLQPVAVAVSVVTTLLTPWFVRFAEPFAGLVDRALPAPLQTFASLYGRWIEQLGEGARARSPSVRRRYVRVLVLDAAGLALVALAASRFHGVLTQIVARWTSMPVEYAQSAAIAIGGFVALPFFVGGVRAAQRLSDVLVGEAVPERAAGVDVGRASRRVLSVPLHAAALALLCATPLAVIASRVSVAWVAVAAGAIVVLLGALLWTRAADLDGHVRAVVQVAIEALASQSRSEPTGASQPLEDVTGAFEGIGSLVTVRLAAGSHAVGRSLAALDLRSRTGATVLVLQRGDAKGRAPIAREAFEAGDALVLAGATEAIERARRLLARGEVDEA